MLLIPVAVTLLTGLVFLAVVASMMSGEAYLVRTGLWRAIRRLARRAKFFASLEHESLRIPMRERISFYYGVQKPRVFRHGALARHKELESLTFGSVDQRSIQLS